MGGNAVWHAMDAAKVLSELNTDSHRGLTEEEAKKGLRNTDTMSCKRKKVYPHLPFLSINSRIS